MPATNRTNDHVTDDVIKKLDLSGLTPEQIQHFVNTFNANHTPKINPAPQPKPFVPTKPVSKHWLKSKTMRFNLGALVTTIAAAVMPSIATIFPIAETMLPVAKLLVSPESFLVLSTVLTTGNMALRKVTKDKIHFKKGS